jgi:long-chain acyl-CoA synthetase
MPQFDAAACLDAIESDRCNWLVGAPFMFSEMVAAQQARPRDLGSLKFCVAAGDSPRPKLAQEVLAAFGVELKSIWAATEVMGSVLVGSAGSVGYAAPGALLRLVDGLGCEVRNGDIGELQVKGRNLTIGYWDAPGRINPACREGWFATGDLMRFGPGGELFFEGRSKDVIICGGTNISPLEVEAVLLSHPAVMEAGVCGADHPALGQVVVAAVRLGKTEGGAAIGDILELARERLADYKVPQRIEVLSKFPRNALGKMDRRAFQQLMRR